MENPLNVFVLGMDAANLDALRSVPESGRYRFHPLLTVEELQHGEIRFEELLARATAELDAFEGGIHAVVGYWDFPVSTLLPLLRERYGLPGPSLESVVRCEHKYWSRLVQREVAEEIPPFALLDLDGGLDGECRPPEDVTFPMWLKPSVSFSSELAFGVGDMAEFTKAVAEMREGIGRVGEPFEDVMRRLDLPDAVAAAGGAACLAEGAMTGEQVAVEGYTHRGEVTVYGVLDSVDYPGRSSFLRHQYPSSLPAAVTDRLKDVSQRVMGRIGMDEATFSIEFFHEPSTGEVRLLEINPRHSQSHAELFDWVDGVPNHDHMIRLGLGETPRPLRGEGPYDVAAKWYHRRFADGVVRRVPTPGEVARIQEEIPGTRVDVTVEAGQRLAELPEQDSYSYELAHVFVGARDTEELLAKYDRVIDALHYEIVDVEETPDVDGKES